MSVLEVALIPPTCALCFRSFPGRRGVQCPKCSATVCRRRDRACLALHMAEVHP